MPVRNKDFSWKKGADGIVVVEIEHKGIYDKIAQKFFNTPKSSHISLDKYGSFVWLFIDGKNTVYQIGKNVGGRFGKEAEPLYPRLIKFLTILNNNSFIKFPGKKS